MRNAFGVGKCELDGLGTGQVVTDQHRAVDVERIEDGRDFRAVFVGCELRRIRTIGPAVPEKVERHSPPRRELRQEIVVDAVIVGESVEQDDRRVFARNLAHEDAAVRRVDESSVGEHICVSHGVSFHQDLLRG